MPEQIFDESNYLEFAHRYARLASYTCSVAMRYVVGPNSTPGLGCHRTIDGTFRFRYRDVARELGTMNELKAFLSFPHSNPGIFALIRCKLCIRLKTRDRAQEYDDTHKTWVMNRIASSVPSRHPRSHGQGTVRKSRYFTGLHLKFKKRTLSSSALRNPSRPAT
jgi:hypothetical protein